MGGFKVSDSSKNSISLSFKSPSYDGGTNIMGYVLEHTEALPPKPKAEAKKEEDSPAEEQTSEEKPSEDKPEGEEVQQKIVLPEPEVEEVDDRVWKKTNIKFQLRVTDFPIS